MFGPHWMLLLGTSEVLVGKRRTEKGKKVTLLTTTPVIISVLPYIKTCTQNWVLSRLVQVMASCWLALIAALPAKFYLPVL